MTIDLQAASRGSALHRLQYAASALLVALLAAAMLVWLGSTLVAIANFALRYPAFDQLRVYPNTLTLPFPDSVIQSENGHRPVLPALVRIADTAWSTASQHLQIYVGIGAALLSLLLIVATIARERPLSAGTRTGLSLLAVLALFWLGNARALMHDYEQLNDYLAILFTVLAIRTISRTSPERSAAGLAIASAYCVAAAFCHGVGLASFAAVFLLAFVRNMPWRSLAVPAAILAATLSIYAFVLPGSGGVRTALALDPLGNLAAVVRWLSSPWMHAWFDQAATQIDSPSRAPFGYGVGALLDRSARYLAERFGPDWRMRESLCIGSIGVAVYAATVLHARSCRTSGNPVRLLGLGLSTFAFAAAAIVCVARLRYFETIPNELFAERYLPWSCLFWLGLALYIATAPAHTPRRSVAVAAVALVATAALLPSHRVMTGWSATVHRNIQQSAVAAQLGVWDPQRLPDNADARRADVLRTLDLLRREHLSMYAEPAYQLLERNWSAPLPLPTNLASASAQVVREFDDTLGRRRVAAFEGFLPHMELLPRDPTLVVVDANGTLHGLAKTSFIGKNQSNFRFNVPLKHGFDGYVLDPQPGKTLHVLVLNDSQSSVLASIPLHIPDNPPAR